MTALRYIMKCMHTCISSFFHSTPLSLYPPLPLSLDVAVVDPEDPSVETLTPFARIDEETGRLIYEEGSSEATVFPGNTLL